MPPGGQKRDIDTGVMEAIHEHWVPSIEGWDRKYPENPVLSGEDEGDGEENGD